VKTVEVKVTINYRDDLDSDVAWAIDKMPDVFYNIGYDEDELSVSVENPL
jgi:predicted membrane GTPase involved in stress response